MNIPPEAIQAATEAMLNQPNADLGITLSLPGCKGMSIPDGYAHLATAALEAALPHIRAQISSELRQLSHEADTPAEQLGYLLAAIHVNEGTLQ